jgi:hypothetical protein
LFQYFSLVIFLFVVEFLFATLAFVFRENLGGTLKEELTEGIKVHYNATGSNSLENIWNHIHKEVLLESFMWVTVLPGKGKSVPLQVRGTQRVPYGSMFMDRTSYSPDLVSSYVSFFVAP